MKEGKFRHGTNQTLNCQVLELPYSGDALSMFIVLPDKVETKFSDVDSKLTADILLDIEKSFEMSKHGADVSVWIPKFKLDESLELLTKTLQAMGMSDAFSVKDADFSAMTGKRDLVISKVSTGIFSIFSI